MVGRNFQSVTRGNALILGASTCEQSQAIETTLSSVFIKPIYLDTLEGRTINYVIIPQEIFAQISLEQVERTINDILSVSASTEIYVTFSASKALSTLPEMKIRHKKIQVGKDYTNLVNALLLDTEIDRAYNECKKRFQSLGNSDESLDTQLNNLLRNGEQKILIAGSPSRHTNAMVNHFEGLGSKVVAALTVPQAVRYLETEQFDSILVFPEKSVSIYKSLLKLIRRNSKSGNIPVFVLTDRSDYNSGFLACGANFAFKIEESTVFRLVEEYAEAYRKQKSLQNILAKSFVPHREFQSKSSALSFFESHIDNLYEDISTDLSQSLEGFLLRTIRS